jgi:adenylate cyclase class 2
MSTHRGVETEIKLAVPSAAHARRLLRKAGFHQTHRRAFESNQLFDTADGRLYKSDRLLRVRTWGRQTILTFKGPRTAGGAHKSTEEIETGIAEEGRISEILERLGMVKSYRYEKYRTVFQVTGEAGEVTLDETPVGVFLELEGKPAWIDRTARRLGYSKRDYITATYSELHRDYCRRHGIKAGSMVFTPQRASR